ncbi:MAG TPA: hypothetical protein VK506_09000 [Conexibacter sp.]|nr:hypothetical protein [Conexibacter sp.]
MRTQTCSIAEARTRLEHARKFLEVATLVAHETGDTGDLEYASVSATLAVMSGIAASDAACCKALGRRARGQDHREAETLLAAIEPGGRQAAGSLQRLLGLKDEAQYGFYDVGSQQLRTA